MRSSARLRLALAVVAAMAIAACAPRRFAVPTTGGTPDPSLAEAYRSAVAGCADLQSITADIGLGGRVDGRRVRGTLQVGLTRDGGVRMEAVAPFGAPIFTIAGRAHAGTLWLPRSQEVVRAAPSDILEALTGVALPPAGLFEIVTGCPGGEVERAERFASPDLARVVLSGGSEVWWPASAGLAAPAPATAGKPGAGTTGTPGPALQPIAIRREGALAEYLAFAGGRPQKLRLSTPGGAADGRPRADLTLTVRDVEANVALGDEAFRVDVPAGATTLAVSDLRQAGILR